MVHEEFKHSELYIGLDTPSKEQIAIRYVVESFLRYPKQSQVEIIYSHIEVISQQIDLTSGRTPGLS
jgi:hypothetical protein